MKKGLRIEDIRFEKRALQRNCRIGRFRCCADLLNASVPASADAAPGEDPGGGSRGLAPPTSEQKL